VAGFFVRGRIAAMKYRKLRIAWSVAWGIAAVLLVALWVRGYWWFDCISGPIPAPFTVQSLKGNVDAIKYLHLTSGFIFPWKWVIFAVEDFGPPTFEIPSWSFTSNQVEVVVRFPYWIVVLIFATFAATPWLGSRFTLRTLLIATTLVAVGLGLIVWAAGAR